MKHPILCCVIFIPVLLFMASAGAATEIPADHPYIQYFGRWDFTDPKAPSHSWPGVYIYAEFDGTSIGVTLNDNFCYYNVIIDGAAPVVFHPANAGIQNYMLATGLSAGKHTILFHKRNETTWAKFSFHGFILDDGKSLQPPPARPERKMEFIGDSFTSASGNEYDKPDKPENDAPLTNIYAGFGPITARYFGAQYMMTSRSGYGMVMDWQGALSGNVPDIYSQTHTFTATPPWDFRSWIPNLVVIGLGLNDYSGFGGWKGPISETNKNLYKTRYHQFMATIRDNYPGVKILAVAPHVEWLQSTILEVVSEEHVVGNNDVFYAKYSYYEGGYVYEGHPNVATHRKIADELIAAIEKIDAWEPYDDKKPPQITKAPASPFASYSKDVTLSFETDTYATMKYSSADKPWDQMELAFSQTGQRNHSVTIPCTHGKTYAFYFRAADIKGNMMTASHTITFTVDTSKVQLNWIDPGYDDSTWKSAAAPLGYMGSGIKTTTSSVITVYFRRAFQIADASAVLGMGIFVKGHDGAVVYLNGHQLERINVSATEEITSASIATVSMNMNKMVVINSANGLNYLKTGENIVAVEMHTADLNMLGLLFDGQLIDNRNAIYFKLGAEWKYSDTGITPEAQIKNKVTSVTRETAETLPTTSQLWQNFPNPFNPATAIRFSLAEPADVSLVVYSLRGEEVDRLVDGRMAAGYHRVTWDGRQLANGVYFYELRAGAYREMHKAVLVK
jgi:hypothetical protein